MVKQASRGDIDVLDVSDIGVEEVELSFPWGAKIVRFTYDVNAHTAAAEERWRKAAEASDMGDAESVLQFVSNLVTWWSLSGDVEETVEKGVVVEHKFVSTGSTFPLERDKIKYLPAPLLESVVTEIVANEQAMGKERRRSLPGG